MKNTELLFILDRSGSMGGLETDTIGGFNATLMQQKELPGKVRVSTLLFNQATEVLHDRIDLEDIHPLTEKEYYVGGSTALYDAVVIGIQKVAKAQSQTRKEARAEKVIVVITTDGYENASHFYGQADAKRAIDTKTEEGWEFIFLGANIDAVATARSIGIHEKNSSDFMPDQPGVTLQYNSLNLAINSIREKGKLDADWKRDLERDMRRKPKASKN